MADAVGDTLEHFHNVVGLMKLFRIITISYLLLLMTSNNAGSECIPETFCTKEPSGFRSIQWGTSITELNDMHLISVSYNGLMRTYVREGDKMFLGDAGLGKLEYLFWKGQLVEVYMRSKGDKNWEFIKKEIFSKYGMGLKDSAFRHRYNWYGNKTEIHIHFEGGMGFTVMTFTSAKIGADVREHAEKKEDKEGRGQLYKFNH
jgi:hypothetical protein